MLDPTLLLLASLADGQKHGYAMMTDIEAFAGIRLGAGTLYGAITRAEQRGLIEAAGGAPAHARAGARGGGRGGRGGAGGARGAPPAVPADTGGTAAAPRAAETAGPRAASRSTA